MSWTGCQKDIDEAVYERMDSIEGRWNQTETKFLSGVSNIRFLDQEIVEAVQKRKKPLHTLKLISCKDCGLTFAFNGGEQNYYERRRLKDPKRCPACRKARKAARRQAKKLKQESADL